MSLLDSVCVLAERWDLDLKPTIGASAWATVARSGVIKADWGDKTRVTDDYKRARKAYYGGRTQVFKPNSEKGYTYDIHSAYPAALASLRLPTGERTYVRGDEAGAAFASGRPGIYRAGVRVAECFIPPLPIRAKLRNGYPVGKFCGWWTALELQSALDRGAVVERITEGMVWSSSDLVLAPFCKKFWTIRADAGAKTPLGIWVKLIINSLTGKMAAKPELERIHSDPDAKLFCDAAFDCLDGIMCGMGCCKHRCTGRCGKLTPMAGCDLPIFLKKYEQLSSHSHVEWSAYLTSYTRAELLRFAGDGADAVYCDTDSLFCERERHDGVGDDLGEWGLDAVYKGFEGLAPKTYRYYEADGTPHGASKGIPDAVANFDRLRQGVTVDRGVNTFKSAVRKGDFFARKNLTRAIKADGVHFGDRKLGPDGRTYPPTVNELADELWEIS